MNLRLMELRDVVHFMASRLDGDIKILASSEAVEAFREMQPSIPGRFISFHINDLVNRRSLGGELVEWVDDNGTTNPAWLNAPIEDIHGFGTGGVQVVTVKREEYQL